MPSFVNFPPPNLPLTGAEQFMIAQQQNNQLVTCTATIGDVIVSNIPPASFAISVLNWFNSLPTSLPITPGVLWNNGGTLAQS
jgi:hypothetical protein